LLTKSKFIAVDKKFLGFRVVTTILKSGGTLRTEAAGALRDQLKNKHGMAGKFLKSQERWRKAGLIEGLIARARMALQERTIRREALKALEKQVNVAIERKAAEQQKAEAAREAARQRDAARQLEKAAAEFRQKQAQEKAKQQAPATDKDRQAVQAHIEKLKTHSGWTPAKFEKNRDGFVGSVTTKDGQRVGIYQSKDGRALVAFNTQNQAIDSKGDPAKVAEVIDQRERRAVELGIEKTKQQPDWQPARSDEPNHVGSFGRDENKIDLYRSDDGKALIAVDQNGEVKDLRGNAEKAGELAQQIEHTHGHDRDRDRDEFSM
jgi:hypothetical protein